MKAVNRQAGVSQIILLVVIAVALAAAYVAIELYTGGEKDMLTVETRGVHMISALSAYRRESGAYPDALDKLVFRAMNMRFPARAWSSNPCRTATIRDRSAGAVDFHPFHAFVRVGPFG